MSTLIWTPGATGDQTVTITATDARGVAAPQTFTVSVLATPAALTTDAAIIAAALDAAPGDALAIASDWRAALPGYMVATRREAGALSATVIGGTDFVSIAQAAYDGSVDPATPNDLAYSGGYGLPHTQRDGTVIGRDTHQALADHPILGRNERLLVGPWAGQGYAGLPWHYASGVAKGVVINDILPTDGTETTANWLGFRHVAQAYDGLTIYLAEVEDTTGAVSIVVSESDTRASSAPWKPPRSIIQANGEATETLYLRKLVTLNLRRWARDDTRENPTYWTLPPKRTRASYLPADHVVLTSGAAGLSDLMDHIATLTDSVIEAADVAVGAPYVIQLQPAIYESGVESTRRIFLRSQASPAVGEEAKIDAAVRALSALTRHTVFLVGEPGRTWLTLLTAGEGLADGKLEVGWCSIGRPRAYLLNGTTPYTYVAGSNQDGGRLLDAQRGGGIALHGCVIDGAGTAPPFTIQRQGGLTDSTGGELVIVDSMALGGAQLMQFVTSANGVGGRTKIGRSVLGYVNDMCQFGSNTETEGFLIEGCVSFDTGGTYSPNIANTHFIGTHVDKGGQFQGQVETRAAVAVVGCNFHSGPQAMGIDSSRGYAQAVITDFQRFRALEYVDVVFDGDSTGVGQQQRGVGFLTMQAWDGTSEDYSYLVNATFSRVIFADAWHVWRPERLALDEALHDYPEYTVGGQPPTDGVQIFDSVMGVRQPAKLYGAFNHSVAMPDPAAQAGDFADQPTPAEAFPNGRDWSGDFGAGFVRDDTGTTYAGTGRAGWLSWADFAAGTPLQSWGGSGPGLRNAASISAALAADDLIDLPASLSEHLGCEPEDMAYPDAPFEAWAPTAFDPANLPDADSTAWISGADDHTMTVVTRFATLSGAGDLIRETDADGASWAVKIVSRDGGLRAEFEVLDTTANSNAVLYRVTSRNPVAAGSTLVVNFDGRLHRRATEAWWTSAVGQTELRRWHIDEAETAARVLVCHAQATAPTVTPATGETHYWIETDADNRLRQWDGAAWADAQGDLSELVVMYVGARAGSGTTARDALEDMTVPTGTWSIHLCRAVADLPVSGGTGDQAYVVASITRFRKWDGSGWATENHRNVIPPRGMVRCLIGVDFETPRHYPDWIQQNAAGTINLPTGDIVFGGLTGTVNYVEAQRGPSHGVQGQALNYYGILDLVGSASRRMIWRWPPLDQATGRRQPEWPAPAIWRLADDAVTAITEDFAGAAAAVSSIGGIATTDFNPGSGSGLVRDGAGYATRTASPRGVVTTEGDVFGVHFDLGSVATTISCVLNQSGGLAAIIPAYVDDANFVFVRVRNAGALIRVVQLVAGVPTQIGLDMTSFTVSSGVDFNFRIERTGNDLEFFVNDVSQGVRTITAHTAATRVGVANQSTPATSKVKSVSFE